MKKMNWVLDFLDLVESRKDTPFQWGVTDCVMFAADAVISQGNPDPAAKSRGKYSTELGAKRHLSAVYGSIEAAWDSQLERLENINFVQNGDVVLFEGAMGTTSGIYWNGGLFAPTMEGVRFVDEQHSNLTAAWRV